MLASLVQKNENNKKEKKGKGPRRNEKSLRFKKARFCLCSSLFKFLLDCPAVGASERGSCAAAERFGASKGSSVLL